MFEVEADQEVPEEVGQSLDEEVVPEVVEVEADQEVPEEVGQPLDEEVVPEVVEEGV